MLLSKMKACCWKGAQARHGSARKLVRTIRAVNGLFLLFWSNTGRLRPGIAVLAGSYAQHLRPNPSAHDPITVSVTTESSFILRWWDLVSICTGAPMMFGKDEPRCGCRASMPQPSTTNHRDRRGDFVTHSKRGPPRRRHKIFKPRLSSRSTRGHPEAVEAYVPLFRSASRELRIRAMQALASALKASGGPIYEFPQSVPEFDCDGA